jgi:hypothetical protein
MSQLTGIPSAPDQFGTTNARKTLEVLDAYLNELSTRQSEAHGEPAAAQAEPDVLKAQMLATLARMDALSA